MNTESQPNNSESKTASPSTPKPKSFENTGTLRRRLLISVLPVVLIPLAVASAIGYKITEKKAENQIWEELEADTVLAEEAVNFFLEDSYGLIDVIAANPQIIEAIKTANEVVDRQNLASQPIESLEKQFVQTKLVQPNESLNNYLQKAVESSRAAEIHFSQANGFNVGYSNETSDFVQSDESWWQNVKAQKRYIGETEYDESIETNVIQVGQVIEDSQTGEFLGVLKANMSVTELEYALDTYLHSENSALETTQIVDLQNQFVIANIDHSIDYSDRSENPSEDREVIGGEAILQVAKILKDFENNALSLTEVEPSISKLPGFSKVVFHQDKTSSGTIDTARFAYQDKLYSLSTISGAEIASIAVTDSQVIAEAGRALLATFAITGVILGAVATGLIILLARQISQPLTNLSAITQKAASGNLDVTASLEGTVETRTLADNFNQLVSQVKGSLQEQTALADEQRQEKEQLEVAIYTLLDEVSDATNGDLTVRANLDNLELSTVADLFNAIIDNLQDIAIEAKESTTQVGSSLKQNESAIRFLAEQAITEAQETRNTLLSVEQMSQSIREVAENANKAEQIVDDTYSTVLIGTENMDLTVNSILELRNTVGETARKMKHLGESSRKISQVTSLIEEIALKTNVLAINASSEADRAGEYGQGFAIVAEQVGSLAKQCSAATKEIAKMVAAIQSETNDVNQAMISGTTQVAKTTHLVQSTKKSLTSLLEKSQEINQLMGSISQNTISQADTSENVTVLMQKIAQLSETTSASSQEVAQSIVETAQIAAKLQSTVAQFKVAEE